MTGVLCRELVGRQAELQVLRTVLDRPAGQVVAVVGEAGVGKTRLVEEFGREASARGWRVFHGRSTPEARATAYRPVQEMLLDACRHGGPPEAPGLAPFRPALGRLLPQWRGEADPAESGVVLAEGVLRLLSTLARSAVPAATGSGRPVVAGALVVLEDLHWSDPETLGVLEHLADHAAGPLVVVVTLRPEPGPGCSVVTALAARRVLHRLDVGPLSGDAVLRMARSCLGGGSLPEGLPSVLARAEGLPLLVEELLGGGAVEQVDGAWTVPARAPWIVPQSLADALDRKVVALPVEDRLVPRAAAVLGQQVDVELLAALLGRPVADVERVLDRCVKLQLCARDGNGDVRFRHALTRDGVRAQLGPASRAELAGRALHLIRAAHPELPGEWCTRAAELCRYAGDDLGAAQLVLTSGRRALQAGALTTAEELLAGAETLCGDHAGMRRQIAELRVEVAVQVGDVDTAITLGRELWTWCDEAPTRARLSLRLADAATAAGRWGEALDELARARDLADDGATLVRVDAVSARALLGCGRIDEARATAGRALAAAEALDHAEPACVALEVLGRIARNEDVTAAEELFGRQLKIADTHDLTLWRIKATHELGTTDLVRCNDVVRLVRARERAARAGAVSMVATLDLQLAQSATLSWDVDAALAAGRRCQDTARLTGLGLLLAEALLAEAGAHALTGDRAAMEASLRRARAAGPESPELDATAHARRGLHALLRDDAAGALDHLEAAVTLSRTAPAPYRRTFWHSWALLRSLGDADDDGAAARAEVRPGTPAGTVGWALLQYAEAAAAGRAGRPADAEQLVTGAQEQLAAPGVRAQRHLADRLVAGSALANGWGDPVGWLTAAAGFFHDAGQVHLERGCRSLLRHAGAPLVRRGTGHRSAPPELAARGITDREADVLALVAEGLTSGQIARRLFISPRTVDKHVERLLVKTGLTRRAELRHLLPT